MQKRVPSKKIKIFIIIILILSVALYFLFNRADHVSVDKVFTRSFIKQTIKNESKLYTNREKLDPAFTRGSITPTSNIDIDVVIPLVEKDLPVVKYTIEAVRKLVGHKIGRIYLVSPESDQIRLFAEKHDCTFVLEDDVLPSDEIKKYGGWIVQQFLKLNADKVVTNNHYLVVDADTIFLRPLVFEKAGVYLVNTHWDISPDRKKMTAKLLGNTKVFQYDLVAHNMLFSKEILAGMKKHIENRFQKRWDLAALELFHEDKNNVNGFAEYDLYMTYLTEFSGAKFRFISNANITVYRDFLNRLDHIIPAYSHQYKSISLHHFILFNK